MRMHGLARVASTALLANMMCMFRSAIYLHAAEVTARLTIANQSIGAHKKERMPPAVIWLKTTQAGAASAFPPNSFTLLQKNKMFSPQLLVIPVGSSVAFPNADPFFHNVFSLFDGKRFDLGLYEAGSTRSVVFSREGVSYIFCNIHSEMSAVVVALTTPLYSVANARGEFRLKDVPDGDYFLHVWVEGQHRNSTEEKTRLVHVTGTNVDLGEVRVGPGVPRSHLNKFGLPYEPDAKPIY